MFNTCFFRSIIWCNCNMNQRVRNVLAKDKNCRIWRLWIVTEVSAAVNLFTVTRVPVASAQVVDALERQLAWHNLQPRGQACACLCTLCRRKSHSLSPQLRCIYAVTFYPATTSSFALCLAPPVFWIQPPASRMSHVLPTPLPPLGHISLFSVSKGKRTMYYETKTTADLELSITPPSHWQRTIPVSSTMTAVKLYSSSSPYSPSLEFYFQGVTAKR